MAQGFKDSGEYDQESSAHNPFALLMAAMYLSNDIIYDSEGKVIGDPTEIALYVAAKEASFDKEILIRQFPRVAVSPLTPNGNA